MIAKIRSLKSFVKDSASDSDEWTWDRRRSACIDSFLNSGLWFGAVGLTLVSPFLFASGAGGFVWAGAISLAIFGLARWRLHSDEAKATLLVVMFLTSAAGLLICGGISGGVSVAIEAALTMCVLFLSRRSVGLVLGSVAASLILVATLNVSGRVAVHVVDLRSPGAWALILVTSFPAGFLVVRAIHEALIQVEAGNERLRAVSEQLIGQGRERHRLEKALMLGIEDLHKLAASRTADLVNVRDDTKFFADQSLSALTDPIEHLHGQAEILLQEAAPLLDDEGRDILSRLTARLGQLPKMISEFRKLGGIGLADLTRAKVDVSVFAQAVFEELRELDPGRIVAVSIEPAIIVDADTLLAESAIRNLLENAWKFTSSKSQARIEVSAAIVRGQPGFSVRDNGPGFAESQRERMFEAFFRASSTGQIMGSGIGLSTVKRIVTRHGGHILAQSQPGLGATFSISFGQPMAEEPVDLDTFAPEEQIPDSVLAEHMAIKWDSDWKRESLRALLIAQLLLLVFGLILTDVLIVKEHLKLSAYLPLLWLLLPALGYLLWRRAIPLRRLALFGLVPSTAAACLSAMVPADLTAACGYSVCAVCFGLMYFGAEVAICLAALSSISLGIGFWRSAIEHAPTIQLPEGSAAYWIGRITMLLGPSILFGVTLVVADSRLRRVREEGTALVLRLREAEATRESLLHELRHVNDRLDAIVALHTSELERAIEELSSITFMVGHDLRGPIRAINAYARILVEDYSDVIPAGIQEDLRELAQGVRCIGRFVDDFIALAKAFQVAESLQEVDLSQLLRSAASQTDPVEVELQGDLRLTTRPHLAKLAVDALVAGVDRSSRRLVVRAIADSHVGEFEIVGCSELFLSSIAARRQPIQLPSAGKKGLPPYFPPISVLKICERQGGDARIVTYPDGRDAVRIRL